MGAVDLALAAALLLLIGALLRLGAAERRHRRVFDHLPQTAIVVFDDQLRVRFAAGPALAELDSGSRGLKGRFLLGAVPQAQRAPLLIHYRAALRGEQRSFEYHSTRSGRDYWVRIVPMADRHGEVTGGLSVALDVGDRKLEGDLGVRSSAVDAVTAATRALARSVDADGARTAVCEGAREVAEAPVAALFEPDHGAEHLLARAWVGADLSGLKLSLTGGGGAAFAFRRAEETFVALAEGEKGADLEFMRRAGARSVLWHPVIRQRAAIGVLAIAWREDVAGVSLRLSAMIDLLGAEAAVAIGRADLLGQLEHLARTDELTALPNRRHWEHQLPRELARAWRAEQSICVAMLDLDHFKLYNDRRGHQAGDRLLAASAHAWREALRPYDVLARYGGEEFSVILPGCELGDGVALVERLRTQTPEGESCSAGIAQWDGEESAEALVGRADEALYRAKRAGRDQTITASPA